MTLPPVHPAGEGRGEPESLQAERDKLAALHMRHADLMVELAMELRQPRMPLGTVLAITIRRLAEMAQESLAAAGDKQC